MHLRILLLFVLLSSILNAQSPYEINWNKEAIYLGLGGATAMTSQLLKVEPLTLSEIMSLQSSAINSFDRDAVLNISASAKTVSDVFLLGSTAFLGALLLDKKSRSDWEMIALLYGETFLLNGGLTYLSKRITKRTRPFVYNELVDLNEKQKADARHSFFSGHTSLAAANSFFVAKLLSDYYPKNKWRYVIWSSAILIPAATGYMRVKAGKHFKTDVIAGYVLGGLIGYSIPHLHKIKQSNSMSLQIAPSGFRLVKRF